MLLSIAFGSAGPSESKPQRHLQLPVRIAVQCAGDGAEVGGADVTVWIRKMRRVRQVVEFGPVLQIDSLAERKITEH